ELRVIARTVSSSDELSASSAGIQQPAMIASTAVPSRQLRLSLSMPAASGSTMARIHRRSHFPLGKEAKQGLGAAVLSVHIGSEMLLDQVHGRLQISGGHRI